MDAQPPEERSASDPPGAPAGPGGLPAFHRKLRTITKARLFSRARLAALWELHTGQLDGLIDWEAYRYPYPRRELADLATPRTMDAGCPRGLGLGLRPGEGGLQVVLAEPSRARRLQLALGANGIYLFVYVHGRHEVTQEVVPPNLEKRASGLSVFEIAVPAEAVRRGYSRIIVIPLRGPSLFCVGQLQPLPGKPARVPAGPGPVAARGPASAPAPARPANGPRAVPGSRFQLPPPPNPLRAP